MTRPYPTIDCGPRLARVVLLMMAVSLPGCGPGPPTGTTIAAGSGRVTAVTDGDTIVVQVDGREEEVRLIGINAPEFGDCLAEEATDRLGHLVEGEVVSLEGDTSDRDQYGRLLRYVYIDGQLVNETLVREGLADARRYPPDTAKASTLDAAERQAIEDERGLWAATPCGP